MGCFKSRIHASTFADASSFNSDLSKWNVSGVVNMNGMFMRATAFDQNLSEWNIAQVTEMPAMFYGASAFNQNLSGWNVSQAPNFNSMFRDAISFNQDLSSWDVSSAKEVRSIFWNASSFNQDLCSWGSKLAKDCVTENMFFESGCDFLMDPSFQQEGNGPFCASNCKEMSSNPGESASTIPSDPNTPFACSEDHIASLQQSAVTNFTLNANGCVCFDDGAELKAVVDRFLLESCTDSSNCNDTIVRKYGMPMGAWCVSKVTAMDELFSGAQWFDDDISAWDVSKVTQMRYMFYDASSFNQDLSSWNVSSVSSMEEMFSGASSFNQNLSNWNVTNVTSMKGMFRKASSFNGDVSNFDVSSVTDMSGMFFGASSFNQDLSSWNVSSATDLRYMFQNATSFNQDISAWDVSKANKIWSMFEGASSFNQNLCSWGKKLPRQRPTESMFVNSGCLYSFDPILEQGGPFCASCCTEMCSNQQLLDCNSEGTSGTTDERDKIGSGAALTFGFALLFLVGILIFCWRRKGREAGKSYFAVSTCADFGVPS